MPGTPDSVLDLGGGMRATFLAAGGRLLSGGQAAITNDDLNSESVSVLVEYQQLRLPRVGRSHRRRQHVDGEDAGRRNLRRPNGRRRRRRAVESSRQHDDEQSDVPVGGEGGSRRRADRRANTFGHPNRETVNKYLNTPVTNGNAFTGHRRAGAGRRPGLLSERGEPAGDDRVTQQGYTGAGRGHAGQGTIGCQTDGTTTYSLTQLRRRRRAAQPARRTPIAVDGASPGSDRGLHADGHRADRRRSCRSPPTSVVVVGRVVNDRESPISRRCLELQRSTARRNRRSTMTLTGGVYQGRSRRSQTARASTTPSPRRPARRRRPMQSGYFSGVTPVSALARAQREG